jgi:hypothetical protein
VLHAWVQLYVLHVWGLSFTTFAASPSHIFNTLHIPLVTSKLANMQRDPTHRANTASGGAVLSMQLALMEMTKWPPFFRKYWAFKPTIRA